MRFATPDGAKEPIGNRIIVLPQNPHLAELRDPHSGFIDRVGWKGAALSRRAPKGVWSKMKARTNTARTARPLWPGLCPAPKESNDFPPAPLPQWYDRSWQRKARPKRGQVGITKRWSTRRPMATRYCSLARLPSSTPACSCALLRRHHHGKLALCDLVAERYPFVIFHGDVGTGKTATAE